ncbi:hypothetical protein BGZ99_008234 [Dissophora globulifera]|uniref:Crinkler effector protein N-terminal domain-containing protein n=1 Tax=Dissophora globulifera TaxID=979702 RepID=A0A9P6R7T0_9FUNG|nr:hypothetical protein BGZ99_008234 [Dissophora globulifera]
MPKLSRFPKAKLSVFCLVESESTSHAFPVKNIPLSNTVYDLKELIKKENPNGFHNLDPRDLSLWLVTIPLEDDDGKLRIWLDNLTDKDELHPRKPLSAVFSKGPPDDSTYIIVQRSHPAVAVQTPVSPLPGSRPSTPLSGDLRVDIKRITDRFFAPGSVAAQFLDSIVREAKTRHLAQEDHTIHDFMKAHVEDSSERDDQDISPFYFLTPEVSGPDIMFFLQIKGVLYPVFFQLKLRHVLQTTDA